MNDPVEETEENPNLKLWNQVCETDPQYTKAASDGRRQFTAIDAYSQIQRATEMWGPYGAQWGLRGILYHPVGETLFRVEATFFWPDLNRFEDNAVLISKGDGRVESTGKFQHSFTLSTAIKHVSNDRSKPDQDFPKKAETNLITKALSRLGFNVDVFLGKFEDNQYIEQRQIDTGATDVPDTMMDEFLRLFNAKDEKGNPTLTTELAAFTLVNSKWYMACFNKLMEMHGPTADKTKIKKELKERVTIGNDNMDRIAGDIQGYLRDDDKGAIQEAIMELNHGEKRMLNARITPEEADRIGEIMNEMAGKA